MSVSHDINCLSAKRNLDNIWLKFVFEKNVLLSIGLCSGIRLLFRERYLLCLDNYFIYLPRWFKENITELFRDINSPIWQ